MRWLKRQTKTCGGMVMIRTGQYDVSQVWNSDWPVYDLKCLELTRIVVESGTYQEASSKLDIGAEPKVESLMLSPLIPKISFFRDTGLWLDEHVFHDEFEFFVDLSVSSGFGMSDGEMFLCENSSAKTYARTRKLREPKCRTRNKTNTKRLLRSKPRQIRRNNTSKSKPFKVTKALLYHTHTPNKVEVVTMPFACLLCFFC